MATFGYPNLKIELDVSSGGALGDISAYVTSINGFSVEALVEELTAAGDSDDRWGAIGFTSKGEVVLEGPYDNTASKLVAITIGGLGETRTLQLTWDVGVAADVQTMETIIQKVERIATARQLTKVRVTLRPTGAIS